jgi:hypothetical protein
MKKIKFLSLLFVGLSFFLLQSCSKDDDTAQDPRDQYVGSWKAVSLGNLTFFENGQSVATVPVNDTETVTISKSGSNILIIDGVNFIVNGNNLSTNQTPFTENINGFALVGTVNTSGTLGTNIITLDSSLTATWNNASGSGNMSGNLISTLTKL